MTSETNRALARLHLDLAHAFYTQREVLGLSIEELADAAGIPTDRILMIEEGDTSSLSDVARLCNALHLELRLDADFNVRLISLREPDIKWITGPSEPGARSKGVARWSVQAPPNQWGTFEQPVTGTETRRAYARN